MKQQNFIGVNLDALTYDQMFEMIDRWLADKSSRSHHIACINAYCTVMALKDERLARIYAGADIAGVDGVPFVKWIKATLRTPCDRLCAPDTLMRLAEHSKKTGYTFYLYGGAPDVVKKMKDNLEEKFAHIRIVGYHSPPFVAMTAEEDEKICEEINRLKPDILCVGLGTPKQDYWIDDHISKIRGTVMIACGATFDFFGGRINRAPVFIQRSGFEWLYRMMKDFRRLWKRYTIMNALFMWNFFLQQLRIRKYPCQRWNRGE